MNDKKITPSTEERIQDRISGLSGLNLKAIFVSSFFLGLIPIAFTAATNNLSVVLIFGVAIPLIFLIAYWVIGQFTRQAIEQQESFADSIYYLGFLLTLASLLAALFSLRGEQPELGMLAARFGLALATTIFGLFIRVTIVNFERDLDDEEKRAQESLTHGVNQFQAEVERLSDQLQMVLGNIAQQTHDLGQETVNLTREQLSELQKRSEETHKAFTSSNTELLEGTSAKFNDAVTLMHNSLIATLNEANESIKAAAQGTTAVFAALQEAPSAYQKRTEQNIQKLEDAQRQMMRVIAEQNKYAERIAEQSKTSSQITNQLNQAASETAAQLQKVSIAGNAVGSAVQNVGMCLQQLEKLGNSVQRFESAIAKSPVEVEAMLPKFRAAMNEISDLSRSGEASLRLVQKNLVGATEAIIHHLKQQ